MKIARRPSAFTLIELLVVISILGILAALTVPALKNLGKSNIQASASRQLLDDVARARQLAISGHTTVYMVFVNTNFWINSSGGNAWINSLNSSELTVVSNLLDKQLSGYNFVAYGALGDQPGQHNWHYLDKWQSLPQGFIIAPWKFGAVSNTVPFRFTDTINNNPFGIYLFDYTNGIPFPLADSNLVYQAQNGQTPYVPYIAFDYTGKLISESSDFDFTGSGADIPISQGYVSYPFDSATKIPIIPSTPLGPNDVTENVQYAITNGTSITYSIVHIDPLTGRPTLLFHQVQ